jgi:hypothetical protein
VQTRTFHAFRRLEVLKLTGTGVTDDGIAYLSDRCGGPACALRELDIGSPFITNAVLNALKPIAVGTGGLPRIQRIGIWSSAVKKPAVAAYLSSEPAAGRLQMDPSMQSSAGTYVIVRTAASAAPSDAPAAAAAAAGSDSKGGGGGGGGGGAADRSLEWSKREKKWRLTFSEQRDGQKTTLVRVWAPNAQANAQANASLSAHATAIAAAAADSKDAAPSAGAPSAAGNGSAAANVAAVPPVPAASSAPPPPPVGNAAASSPPPPSGDGGTDKK